MPAAEDPVEDAVRHLLSLVMSLCVSSLSMTPRRPFHCDTALLLTLPTAILHLAEAGINVGDMALTTEQLLMEVLANASSDSTVCDCIGEVDIDVANISLASLGWPRQETASEQAIRRSIDTQARSDDD